MPRRKPGALLPIEVDILDAALSLRHSGTDEFHGFALAASMAGGATGRKLTAHGTLYKALGRLEADGLLASKWEDSDLALEEGRPRRRLYTVTGLGERKLSAWRLENGAHLPRARSSAPESM